MVVLLKDAVHSRTSRMVVLHKIMKKGGAIRAWYRLTETDHLPLPLTIQEPYVEHEAKQKRRGGEGKGGKENIRVE